MTDNYVPTYPVFRVRYLGPTNTKGGRFKATCDGRDGSITEPYDHSTGGFGGNAPQAKRMALALREKIAPGALPPGNVVVGEDKNNDYVVIITS